MKEVPLFRESLLSGDVFVLDKGLEIYQVVIAIRLCADSIYHLAFSGTVPVAIRMRSSRLFSTSKASRYSNVLYCKSQKSTFYGLPFPL